MSARKRRSKGISDAVDYLTKVKTRQKFKGNDEMVWALETVEHTAQTSGLDPQQIESLVDVAAAGIQIESVCKRVIKALIPATIVPERAVVKCVSWLCTGKPSINMKCLLLRWILVIYDYMDTRESLHALYGVLFHFLHYRTLMPYICHLLYMLTRKEDVRLFRVRHLIQYQKDMGAQPFLTGLLSIYRHYYPNLIHVVKTRSYKSFFPTYDRKWSAGIRKVREQNGSSADTSVTWEQRLVERLHPAGQTQDLVPSRKRRKVDPIPVVHSLMSKSNYRKDRLGNIIGNKTVPFVLIHCFKDILDNIESIEFPSQIGAVLRSESLKHVMSYTKDPIAAARFEFWIAETLHEELTVTDRLKFHERVSSLLNLLRLFSDFLQEGIPTVDNVISDYLQRWNGLDYAPLILKLVARCHLYSFPALNQCVLEPLRRLFFCSSVYFKCKVITCMTEMLRNHAANEWPRMKDTIGTNSSLSLFSRDSGEFSVEGTVLKFIQYVCKMILAGSVAEKFHPLYELCTLDFLEVVSSMHKEHGVPFVFLVESRLFERLFISRNPHTVARLCTIMCRYKENLTSLKKQHVQGGDELQTVRRCNQLIIDIANCLWRFRAYNSSDQKSIFHCNLADIDDKLDDREIAESLSIITHPALLPFTVKYVRVTLGETAIDPSKLKHLKKDLLQHLDDHNLSGLQQFVSTFVRSRPETGSSPMTPGKNSIAALTANTSTFGF